MMVALSAGMTAEEIILNGISKATDPSSGGRHMSNHFAKPEWNIHNVSSCTGNHTLHAAGVARAMKTYKHKGVAFSSQGESSVSEGYCYEAINGADRELLPVVFVFQDNGYGISVPKCDQTFNERVSDNFRGFTRLQIIQCDGRDIFDSMNAMESARELALKQIPVIVHADCVRIHQHSNSDQHELYRDEAERAAAKAQDPLARFKKLLLENKRLSEAELTQIEEKAKLEVVNAHKAAMRAPDPKPESIHQFVIPEPYIPSGAVEEKGENKTFIQAINQTLKAEFRHNPDTYILGPRCGQ
jgi:2-oxoisovalerate dehydrogenase E1 component